VRGGAVWIGAAVATIPAESRSYPFRGVPVEIPAAAFPNLSTHPGMLLPTQTPLAEFFEAAGSPRDRLNKRFLG
jgi:hypothetical protein